MEEHPQAPELKQGDTTNLKKRQRSSEEEEEEPAAKRIKQEPSPPPQVLFALTYKRLDDDYKRIEDHEAIIGLYPSHQLALACQYDKMVEIITEEMEDRDWHCIDSLPSLEYFASRSGLGVKNQDHLEHIYRHFFEEQIDGEEGEGEGEEEGGGGGGGVISLSLKLGAIKACLSSLTTAKVEANGWCNFEETSLLGYTFSDLFELLFQCEYRIGCQHQFEIERRTFSPSNTEWPELFKQPNQQM